MQLTLIDCIYVILFMYCHQTGTIYSKFVKYLLHEFLVIFIFLYYSFVSYFFIFLSYISFISLFFYSFFIFQIYFFFISFSCFLLIFYFYFYDISCLIPYLLISFTISHLFLIILFHMFLVH